jgi:hypothetical protein
MLAAIRRCSRFTFNNGGVNTNTSATPTTAHTQTNRRFQRDGASGSLSISVNGAGKDLSHFMQIASTSRDAQTQLTTHEPLLLSHPLLTANCFSLTESHETSASTVYR